MSKPTLKHPQARKVLHQKLIAGNRAMPSLAESSSFVQEVKDYAIFMLDSEGHVLTWNEGAGAIKGYSAAEILGQHYSRFYTAEDVARGQPNTLLHQATVDGRVACEGWRVRKDGARFWANVVITAVHEPGGQLRGFVKVTRDLTERRQAEARLRQSEERLRLLVESVKDYAIFMLDIHGYIATWNSGAEHVKGYGAEEVVGKHFSMFYLPKDVAAGNPERELRIATAEGRHEEAGWRVRKGGARFWADVVITAVYDERRCLRGFAKVTRDLTERRRMEQEARAGAERAAAEQAQIMETQRALKERDEFISVAAHELRTPLTALQLRVQSITQVLRKAGVGTALSSKLADRLEGALRQIDRLTELVDRLLDVSRMVKSGLAMDFESMDLAALARSVVEDFREPALHVGSELCFHATSVIGVWDRSRMEQVIMNLLSNAIKYGAGRPIDVRVEATADSARLVVADRGIGIDDNDTQRIFDRFGRGASVRHYGGLGLGLYVARSVVDAHGGSIRVSSRVGEGTEFVVEVPRDPPMVVSRGAKGMASRA